MKHLTDEVFAQVRLACEYAALDRPTLCGPALAALDTAQTVENLFEFWWAEYMPDATQEQAFKAWSAAPESKGVGVAQPVQVNAVSAEQIASEIQRLKNEVVILSAKFPEVSNALTAAQHAQPEQRPTDDALWDETLKDRDAYHQFADDLAAQIAAITGVDIGEHSSVNNPWQEAMLAADDFIATQLKTMLLQQTQPERAPLSETIAAHLLDSREKNIRCVKPLSCPKCHALWLFWPKEQSGFETDTLSVKSYQHCNYCENAKADQLSTLDRVQPQVTPLPDHEIVTMYAECPNSDAEMIEFARAIEAAHGIKQGGQHD